MDASDVQFIVRCWYFTGRFVPHYLFGRQRYWLQLFLQLRCAHCQRDVGLGSFVQRQRGIGHDPNRRNDAAPDSGIVNRTFSFGFRLWGLVHFNAFRLNVFGYVVPAGRHLYVGDDDHALRDMGGRSRHG